MNNVLDISSRKDFRDWLSKNYNTEKECYILLKRGKPIDDNIFYYLDAVEEALCFGWIDSTVRIINGKNYQRFTKRGKNSNWTELNKERVKRLEKLGLMTDAGIKVVPKESKYQIDKEIENILKENRVYSHFKKMHPLYQRVRCSNLIFYKTRDKDAYDKMLKHTIETLKENKTFGQWNDYGRLIDY